MRDKSAENTSPVSGNESDHKLSGLGVLAFRLGPDFLVAEGDSVLESSELDHSVRDLSGHQGHETLVEASSSFLGEFLVSGTELGGEGSGLGSLHSDLKGLHGAEEAISDDLSAGRGKEETDCLVLLGLGAEDVFVDILEDLVEAELSETLHGVADDGGLPSEEESFNSCLSLDGGQSVAQRLVDLGVDLLSALDEVQRSDDGMGQTASEDSSDHTLEVVFHVMLFFFLTCHLVIYN